MTGPPPEPTTVVAVIVQEKGNGDSLVRGDQERKNKEDWRKCWK